MVTKNPRTIFLIAVRVIKEGSIRANPRFDRFIKILCFVLGVFCLALLCKDVQ